MVIGITLFSHTVVINNCSIYLWTITKISDVNYLSLLQKEYRFLVPHKESICEKAKILYNKQKMTNIIGNCYCNFSLLESLLKDYIENKISNL